jgi:hypothetical protein
VKSLSTADYPALCLEVARHLRMALPHLGKKGVALSLASFRQV